tara:strand:- start:72 stop:461 length:390 start_codon:yes stop_codon:yes gene_type:complete
MTIISNFPPKYPAVKPKVTPSIKLNIIAEKPTIKEIREPYSIVDNISLPCPSVPSKNLASPSLDQEGGVKASIKDRLDGSNGLKGATNSTKKEQKKIAINIIVEIIAVGDLIKLKYISLSLILSNNEKF